MRRAGGGKEGAGPGAGPGPSRLVRGLFQLRDPRAAQPLLGLQRLQEVSRLSIISTHTVKLQNDLFNLLYNNQANIPRTQFSSAFSDCKLMFSAVWTVCSMSTGALRPCTVMFLPYPTIEGIINRFADLN